MNGYKKTKNIRYDKQMQIIQEVNNNHTKDMAKPGKTNTTTNNISVKSRLTHEQQQREGTDDDDVDKQMEATQMRATNENRTLTQKK